MKERKVKEKSVQLPCSQPTKRRESIHINISIFIFVLITFRPYILMQVTSSCLLNLYPFFEMHWKRSIEIKKQQKKKNVSLKWSQMKEGILINRQQQNRKFKCIPLSNRAEQICLTFSIRSRDGRQWCIIIMHTCDWNYWNIRFNYLWFWLNASKIFFPNSFFFHYYSVLLHGY